MTESAEMDGNDSFDCPLTPAQLRAIDMLVAGSSYTDVARELDIVPHTLWRWRQLPAFAAELQAQLGAIREAAKDRLAASTDKAVSTLVSVLDSENDSARVAAAKALFDRVGLEPPPSSTTTVAVVPADGAQQQLSEVELRARVRRLVFAELAGLDDLEIAARVREVLESDDHEE